LRSAGWTTSEGRRIEAGEDRQREARWAGECIANVGIGVDAEADIGFASESRSVGEDLSTDRKGKAAGSKRSGADRIAGREGEWVEAGCRHGLDEACSLLPSSELEPAPALSRTGAGPTADGKDVSSRSLSPPSKGRTVGSGSRARPADLEKLRSETKRRVGSPVRSATCQLYH
jgi:hypothetical protein